MRWFLEQSYKFYNTIGILPTSFHLSDFASDNSLLISVDVGAFFFVANWLLSPARELDFRRNIKSLIFARTPFLDEFPADTCLYLGMPNPDL